MSPPEPLQTRVVAADDAGVTEAARLIRAGQPVAVPTETVYGLAADATSGEAVARIYEAKGRPSFNPLIVHVTGLAEAERIGVFGGPARALAEEFWPGPLTIVVPLRPGAGISALVTAGLSTVAIRASAHPVMRAVIAAADRPLAAPSANASGRISATRAAHVQATLDGRIPLILDGGATEHGLESSIVAVDGDIVRLLRPGPIAADALGAATNSSRAVEAPGQFASHYAPAKPLRLNVTDAQVDEWLIGFGPVTGNDSLSPAGDLVAAAARLFDALHMADHAPHSRISVAPIPDAGLGAAINDRLKRAAAPRTGHR